MDSFLLLKSRCPYQPRVLCERGVNSYGFIVSLWELESDDLDYLNSS